VSVVLVIHHNAYTAVYAPAARRRNYTSTCITRALLFVANLKYLIVYWPAMHCLVGNELKGVRTYIHIAQLPTHAYTYTRYCCQTRCVNQSIKPYIDRLSKVEIVCQKTVQESLLSATATTNHDDTIHISYRRPRK